MPGEAHRADAVLSLLSDAVFETDALGVLRSANAAAAALLGLAGLEALAGSRFLDFVSPAQAALAQRWLQTALEGGAVHDQTLTLRRASGESVEAQVSVAGFRSEAGQERGLVLLARDLSQARRAPEDRFRLVIEADRRAYARRLEILHDLSRSILAAGAPAEIASAALDHLDAVVPAAGAAVFSWEGRDAPPSLLARRGLLPQALVAGLDPDQPGGIVELSPSGPAGADHGLRSLLRVPLQAAGQTLGALIVVDRAAGRFGPGDVALAEEVMSQVAIALRQRRLQEAENRRRLELEALAEVSAALRQAASSRGVQRVLTEQLMTVAGAEAAALFILEEAWKVAAVAGRAALVAGGRLAPELADSLSRRFRGDETSWLWTEASPDVAALLTALDPALQAGVLVQLRAAERLPAAVLIGWPAPHAVTSSEGYLLAAIAEIGSNALQRSSLLETLERRVAERTRELSTLYEVAAVANQPSDLASRLESALALTLRAVGAESGTVYQATDDGESLILLAHCGLTSDIVTHLARLPVRGTVTGRVLQTGGPVVLNDMMAEKSSLRAAAPADRLRYIGLPLRSRGRVLGVLGVVGPGDAHLSAESLALLGTIADQLGTLLEAEGLRRQAERAAVAEERQRLARDLHDSVTQSLYSAVLFATAAQEQVDLGAPDRARVFLGRIDAILGQALREMRLLIYELRPAMLEALGLVKALERRLEAVEAHAAIKAQLLVEGDCALPPALEEALYAVAQEALNNALKHSAARTVAVRLRGAAGRVTLEVEDDGRGFDPATAGERGGAGLGNMRERLTRCAGHLQIDSRPGHGTRVTAEVTR